MTLRISVEKVRNREELFIVSPEGGTPELGAVTRGLAEAMYHGHIGSITEANAEEVLRRVRVVEEINGPYLRVGPRDAFFTLEDVERRIGMRLNVETKSRSYFDRAAAYSRKHKDGS